MESIQVNIGDINFERILSSEKVKSSDKIFILGL